MGIRETLNENPAVTTAVTVGILIILLIIIGWQLFGGRSAPDTAAGSQMYYTNDNGQTTYTDEYDAIYTMEGGQPKVRAYMYTWEEGGEPFVAYLERMTPQAIEQYKQAQSEGGGMMYMMEDMMMGGREVKKPGTDKWFPAMSPQGQEIAATPRQDGKVAQAVYPGSE